MIRAKPSRCGAKLVNSLAACPADQAVGSAIDQLNDKPKVSTPAEPEEVRIADCGLH